MGAQRHYGSLQRDKTWSSGADFMWYRIVESITENGVQLTT